MRPVLDAAAFDLKHHSVSFCSSLEFLDVRRKKKYFPYNSFIAAYTFRVMEKNWFDDVVLTFVVWLS